MVEHKYQTRGSLRVNLGLDIVLHVDMGDDILAHFF